MYLEPQGELWGGDPGREFDLTEVTGTCHLKPFDGIAEFDSETTKYTNKTLFRFPLRTEESNLSKNIYTIEKIDKLISALKSEAKLLLLFLRSVTSIEVYNIAQDGKQTPLFQTMIANTDLKRKRKSLLYDLKCIHKTQQYNFSNVLKFTATFDIDVCVYGADTKLPTSRWLVVNQVGSSSSKVREASDKQKVFPWAGMALELYNPGNGQIFCTLPMPIEAASNLPVHVNGTFGLTDDRRSLKWPGVERRNDPTADWNELLLKEVLPSCYVKLLLEAKNHCCEFEFYKAWPDINKLKGTHWEDLLKPVLDALLERAVIWSVSLHRSEWVVPTNAVYEPKSQKLDSIIKDILINYCGVKLAKIPDHLWNAFSYTGITVSSATPNFVCDELKAKSSDYKTIEAVKKHELLKYCLSEEIPDYSKLCGLELLPLADGTFIQFQSSIDFPQTDVFLCTSKCPRYILPNLDHKLVDLPDDEKLYKLLTRVAKSNRTQLKVLSVAGVASLLNEAMGEERTLSRIISVSNSHFNYSWFEKFWKWIQDKSLGIFCGKFIVPVEIPGYPCTVKLKVAKLSKEKALYFYSSCSNTISTILNKFGIICIKRESFPFLTHRKITQHLTSFSSEEMLQAISRAISENYRYSNISLTTQESSLLIKEFHSATNLYYHRLIIRDLKIFTSCSNTDRRSYSIKEASSKSLFNKALLNPYNSLIAESILPHSMILFSRKDYHQSELLNKLNVGAPNNTEFLTQFIFPCIQNGTVPDVYIDKIMIRVLDRYSSLGDSISTSIQKLKFVKATSGRRKRPEELFDPSKDAVSEIYKGEDVFPCAPYNSPRYLQVLEHCGMHTSVSAQEILDAIFSISEGPSSFPQYVNQVKLSRAEAILKYIDTNDFMSQTSYTFCKVNRSIHSSYILPFETAIQKLSSKRSWLPILSKRPKNYPSQLPWKGAEFTSHFVTLNNSVCVTCSDFPSTPLLCGSQVYFTAPVVGTNTSALLGSCEPTIHLVTHFEQVIHHKNYIEPDELLSIIQNSYSAMLKLIDQDSQLDSLRKIKEWIYIKKHDRFVDVDAVAQKRNPDFHHDVEPYLHILPDSISDYSELFTSFGMNETLSKAQIVSILGLIKKEIYYNPDSVNSEQTWSMVKSILNWLTENEAEEISLDSILVPVRSESSFPDLREPSGLVFADRNSLKNLAISSFDDEEPLTFVHDCINPKLAKRLQIKPLSDLLGIDEDISADAGQYESLVVRLKNILSEYKYEDGLTIIKELIQNADDAEATEINICFDNRTHDIESSKLWFPGMHASHGPALVVHSDSIFTDEDFDNIQKLAGATKQEKHTKIGKFGIGFCSVYHITDVPSFISRDRMYIFDPTLKHLEKSGKRLNFSSKLDPISRQLQPYAKLFGFKCNAHYDDTIFRLPFRTSISELSSTCYSQSTVEQLIKAIQQCGDKLVLFLQHIQHITVEKIETGETNPTLLYELRKTILIPLNCASVICVKTNQNEESNDWLVAKYDSLHEEKSGTANVACSLNRSGESKNGYTINTDLQGEVFCFLPLSQTTGLPVHVSCNFAVTNNRRGIWASDKSTSQSDSEVQWNVFLMTKSIPQAYIKLLSNLKRLYEAGLLQDYAFYSLWPLKNELKQSNPWDFCLDTFYDILASEELLYSESINVDKKWLTVQESKFLGSNILCQSGTPPCVLKFVQLFLPIVNLPSSYRSQLNLMESTITEYDFIDIFFENIQRFDSIKSTRNEVICHMLGTYAFHHDDKSCSINEESCQICSSLENKIRNHACIPCGPTGDVIRKCTEVIDPRACFSGLFEKSDNLFPVYMLTEGKHTLATRGMEIAGMIRTSIPWSLVIERAEHVSKLVMCDSSKALEYVKLLLETVSSEMVSGDKLQSSGATIDTIAFLPVMKKPDDYPLKWYGSNCGPWLSGGELMLSGRNNIKLAGSQVAFISEVQPSDGGCGHIGDTLSGILHLRSTPTCEEVITHLKMIIESAHSLDTEWVSDACYEIYKFIEIGISKSDFSEKELEELPEIDCIWNESQFLGVGSVALDWSLDGPYLFAVPPSVKINKNLSSLLGIKKNFTITDAQRALILMKDEFGDSPVECSCIELIIQIIALFQNNIKAEDFEGFDVYLPAEDMVLHESTDLVYNDAPWATNNGQYTYVSKMVPEGLAISLHVQYLRNKMLNEYKNVQFKVFGPHEDIKLRIRNIINAYPFDVTILQELLQNADDAKATKMYVILDKRTHKSKSVPSENWKELQGPALLVWNDSIFSENDLEGIQKVGFGSKRYNPETTGQFGIGFNVVYHLTDCPSFITDGKELCIMDPRCHFLNPQSPGGRFAIDQEFWKIFPDLKPAYLRSGLANRPHELRGGSLFRLPLRSCHSENQSEIIKDVHTTPKELTAQVMSENLQEWIPQLKKAIFFLNSVTEIKYFVIQENSKEMKVEFHYETEIDKAFASGRESFQRSVSSFSDQKGVILHYPLSLIERHHSKTKLEECKEEWLIQQGIGDILQLWENSKDIEFLKPRHGLAAPLPAFEQDVYYSAKKNTVRKDERKERKPFAHGEIFCLLPLPIRSDFPLHVNGHFILDPNRRAIWKCTNPDDPDPKAMWNSNLMKAIAASYAEFLTKAGKQYFIHSTYKNKPEFLEGIHRYYDLFPKLNDNGELCELSHDVYNVLIQSNANILCVLIKKPGAAHSKNPTYITEWLPLKNKKNENQVYFWQKSTDSAQRKSIGPLLESMGMNITYAPSHVMKNINKSISSSKIESETNDDQTESTVPCISPSSVFKYYTEHSRFSVARGMEPCSVTETSFKNIKQFVTFIKYLLGSQSPVTDNDDDDDDKSSKFPEPPFSHYILVTADGVLRPFNSQYKVLNSMFSFLYKESADKFLHPELICANYDPSYFIQPREQDKTRASKEEDEKVLALLMDIVKAELPQKICSEAVVVDASSLLDQSVLISYWKCFTEDAVFKSYLKDILKNFALIWTNDSRLYSTRNDILPVHPLRDSSPEFESMHAILDKLEIPFINSKIIAIAETDMKCPQLLDYKMILNNLFHANKITSLTEKLNKSDLEDIISYLKPAVVLNDPEWNLQLRSLPLFETIHGSFTPLEGVRACLWPERAPYIAHEKWNKANAVFIKPRTKWEDLGGAKQLSINEISVQQFYVEFIFPSFSLMSENERIKYLEHIRDIVYPISKSSYANEENENHIFVRDLKELPCIGSNSSCLRSIANFSDHKLKIFTEFPEHYSILPEQLQSSVWIDFFKEVGLKQIIDKTEYLQLCREVSKCPHKDDINKKSKILIKHLFSLNINKNWHKDQDFLCEVSEIPFAAPVISEKLSMLVPCAIDHLVKLNGAAITPLEYVLWTVRPIVKLPKKCLVEDSALSDEMITMLENLKIIRMGNLCIEDIIKNIRNICKKASLSRQSSDYSHKMLMKVMLTNFEFLCYSNRCSLYQQKVSSLKQLQCIPVNLDKDTSRVILVNPQYVVLWDGIWKYYPFLHKLPPNFESFYTKLLQLIGVKMQFELCHAQLVLKLIFESAKGSELNEENEKHVINVIGELEHLLKYQEKPLQDASILEPLYLPTVDGTLRESTSLTYGDTSDYWSLNMKLDLQQTDFSLCHLAGRKYKCSAFDLCRLLPVSVRPIGLSEICAQKLYEHCEETSTCDVELRIKKAIEHYDVPKIVTAIINRHTSTVSDEFLIKSSLDSLQLKTLKELKVKIVLKKSGVTIGWRNANVYFEPAQPGGCLYLDSDPSDEDEAFLVFAEYLAKTVLTEIPVEDSFYGRNEIVQMVAKCMKAKSLRNVDIILRDIGICIDWKNMTLLSKQLGEDIPTYWHHRLDQAVHIFDSMEYVGYEVKEGHIIMARVAHPMELDPQKHCLEKEYRIYTKDDANQGDVVSVLLLFKFVIGQNMITMKPDDLSSIKKLICEELTEIQTLTKHQLKLKALQRLYLRWHPNKYHEQKAKDIQTYLKRQLVHLKNGEPLDDQGLDIEQFDGDTRKIQNSQLPWKEKFDKWDSSAESHGKYIGYEKEIFKVQTNVPFQSNIELQLKREPKEGWRWVKQAEKDFDMIDLLLDNISCSESNNGYNHVCFIAQQVAEKALKGAVYALCGQGFHGHSLSALLEHLRKVSIQCEGIDSCEEKDSYYEETEGEEDDIQCEGKVSYEETIREETEEDMQQCEGKVLYEETEREETEEDIQQYEGKILYEETEREETEEEDIQCEDSYEETKEEGVLYDEEKTEGEEFKVGGRDVEANKEECDEKITENLKVMCSEMSGAEGICDYTVDDDFERSNSKTVELEDLKGSIEVLDRYSTNTRYPDCWVKYKIPSNQFDIKEAKEAKNHAKNVLDIIMSLMPNLK